MHCSPQLQRLIEIYLNHAQDFRPTVDWAHTQGYSHAIEIAPGVIYAVHPFAYTMGIVGPLTETGYEQRWCYHSLLDALAALNDWKSRGYEGEPDGWHRHMPSGRRRDENGVETIRP